MPYSAVNSRGCTYFLHEKHVTLANGRAQTQYYFAPAERRGEAVNTFPPGHTIREDPRNGRLTVKRLESSG